mgnify:FL=1
MSPIRAWGLFVFLTKKDIKVTFIKGRKRKKERKKEKQRKKEREEERKTKKKEIRMNVESKKRTEPTSRRVRYVCVFERLCVTFVKKR